MGLEAREKTMRGNTVHGARRSEVECVPPIATTTVVSLDRCVLSWHQLSGGVRSGTGGEAQCVTTLKAAEAQSAKETR